MSNQMSYFTTSEINLYFTYNSAKRMLTLKDINDFTRFWHCVKQPFCILTLSNSWHERFCFVLYLWEGRNKRYKATNNRKILMTTVLPGGLFEYTRWPIFVCTFPRRKPGIVLENKFILSLMLSVIRTLISISLSPDRPTGHFRNMKLIGNN
jgi:hypothetical protein